MVNPIVKHKISANSKIFIDMVKGWEEIMAFNMEKIIIVINNSKVIMMAFKVFPLGRQLYFSILPPL